MSLSINLVPHESRPWVSCRFGYPMSHVQKHGCPDDLSVYDVLVSWWCFSNDRLDGRDDGEKFLRRVLVAAASEDQARKWIMKDYGYDSTRIESISLREV